MKTMTLHGTLNVITQPCCGGQIFDFAYSGKLTEDYEAEPMISSSTTAAFIGWTTETLERRRREGKGPKGYVKTSATRGSYPLSEVIKFVNERKHKK